MSWSHLALEVEEEQRRRHAGGRMTVIGEEVEME